MPQIWTAPRTLQDDTRSIQYQGLGNATWNIIVGKKMIKNAVHVNSALTPCIWKATGILAAAFLAFLISCSRIQFCFIDFTLTVIQIIELS
jgi:hypothetical protein